MVVSLSAHGEEPSVSAKETARTLVAEGHRHFREGNLEAAIEAYRGADDIMGVPTTGLLLGRAHEKAGQLLEARDIWLRVTRYPISNGEPRPFAEARVEAGQLADSVAGRIGALEVRVNDAPKDISVSVDGDDAKGVAATLPRRVNPGDHEVVIAAPGYETATVTLRDETAIREGELRVIEVELVAVPVAPVVVPVTPGGPVAITEPPATVPVPHVGEDRSDPSFGPLMWSGFGVGAGGLIVGAITGGLSLSATASVDEQCPTVTTCPATARDDYDRGIALANVSNVSLAIGAVGIATGVIALLVDRADDADVAVRPLIGPAALGIGGRF